MQESGCPTLVFPSHPPPGEWVCVFGLEFRSTLSTALAGRAQQANKALNRKHLRHQETFFMDVVIGAKKAGGYRGLDCGGGGEPFLLSLPSVPPSRAAVADVAGTCHRVAREVSGLRVPPTEISLGSQSASWDIPPSGHHSTQSP